LVLKYSYSINELMNLTGKSFRTIKKRLENLTPERDDGKGGIFYDLRVALPQIFKNDLAPTKSLLDYRLLREKSEARLAEVKAKKLKLELDLMRKTLIPAAMAEKGWADLVSTFRSRMLALPSRAALLLYDMESIQEIETALTEFVYEALNELSTDEGVSVQDTEVNPINSSSSSETETD
jgi:hypothetical protein